jgi:hypothetical protein
LLAVPVLVMLVLVLEPRQELDLEGARRVDLDEHGVARHAQDGEARTGVAELGPTLGLPARKMFMHEFIGAPFILLLEGGGGG